MTRVWYTNDEVADALERIAELLQAQRPPRGSSDSYRVEAFRRAAKTVREHPRSLIAVLDADGLAGLERLPGIGASIASAIRELIETGHLRMLERLEGQISPEDLFMTVPGIGEELARRLHLELGLETLEDLEVAAHDGRLDAVPGFGARRTQAIRDLVGAILSRSTRRRARRIRDELEPDGGPLEPPSVATILAVDQEYLVGADAGALPLIAPRRMNPEGKRWLPILHIERDGFSFTALFSNTARAHQLHTTHDWVVVFFERDGHESQCTVVTETRGPLKGQRVIRGREEECRLHYALTPPEGTSGGHAPNAACEQGSGSARLPLVWEEREA
jgi:hypothetical protein